MRRSAVGALLASCISAACGEGQVSGELALVELRDTGPRPFTDAAVPIGELDAGARGDSAIHPDAEGMDPDPADAAPGPMDGGSARDAGHPDARPPPDAGTPDSGVRPDAASAPGAQGFEDRVLELVNEVRARGTRCGLRDYGPVGPLRMDEALRRAARGHSEDMAQQDYFDHTSLDGRNFADRAREAGYTASVLGENIAAGSSTPEGAFDQWLHSSGHCANMMSARANEIGVGYGTAPGSRWGHYWTQVFGDR